jgi:hypothetical protein
LVKILSGSGPLRVVEASIAVLLIAGIVAVPVWKTWQAHDRSMAVRDARSITPQLRFASASDAPTCRTPEAAFLYVKCVTTPYTSPAALKTEIIHAFGAADIHVTGASCGTPGGIEFCEVWSSHGRWRARVTFTSGASLPSPAALKEKLRHGDSLAAVVAKAPREAWTGVVAVNR